MSSSHPVTTIALVGRPNVGKSTLFNRIAGGRRALVASVPGVTRDRREEMVRTHRYRFRLVDTGGLAFDREGEFTEAIATQVEMGVATADCVWLVVDVVEGLSPFDREVHRWLLRQGKPVFVVVNKTDNSGRKENAAEFFELGTEKVLPVSALHGNGVEEALAETASLMGGMEDNEEVETETEGGSIRIAFLGRPNVGKSSLVNRILGDPRMIVSDIAGTTREAVDVPLEFEGREYLLIDTAGIRRKAKTKEHLEKVGALNAIGTIGRAHVGVLVLDGADSAADQDARIARYILDQPRAMVVALNKWDLVERGAKPVKEVEEDVRHRLRFAGFAPIVRTSGKTGMGIERLFMEIRSVHAQYTRRIQTADLNRVLGMSVLRRSPPARGRVPTKIFYGSQVRHSPPSFSFFTNHLTEIGQTYTRYMENQLRFHFGFKGTPLSIEWRSRRETDKGTRVRRG